MTAMLPSTPPPTSYLDVSTAARRTRWTFLIGITGFAVAMTIAVVAAHPHEFAWGAFAVLAVFVAVLDWLVLRGRTWIDGTTLHQRRIGTQHADVARAASVQLCNDNGCGTRLVVRDDRGACASAALLSLPPGFIRSASPAALQHLATALAQAAAPGADAASQLLRRQAQYVLVGGALRGSPLMPFAIGQYGRLVEAAALIGLIGRHQADETGQRSPD
jgi:hypothetical protein